MVLRCGYYFAIEASPDAIAAAEADAFLAFLAFLAGLADASPEAIAPDAAADEDAAAAGADACADADAPAANADTANRLATRAAISLFIFNSFVAFMEKNCSWYF